MTDVYNNDLRVFAKTNKSEVELVISLPCAFYRFFILGVFV